VHITWLVALSAIKEALMRKGERDGGGERGRVMGKGEGEGDMWLLIHPGGENHSS